MQTTNKAPAAGSASSATAKGMSKGAKTGMIVAAVAAIAGAVSWSLLRDGSSAVVIKPTPEALTRNNMERVVERIRPMLDDNKMPASTDELPPVAGVPAPKPGEPTVNQDGWGHAISIKGSRDAANAKIVVRSPGPDGQADNADDWVLEGEFVIISGKSVVKGTNWKQGGGG